MNQLHFPDNGFLSITVKAALIIGFIELIIMAVIGFLFPELSELNRIVIDVIALSILATPLIVFYVIKPEINSRTSELLKQQSLALHDPLTMLPNRRLLNEILEKTLSGNRRYQYKGALLYFDLDGFKVINDKHGHAVGDEVLKTIALKLLSTFRTEDTISRVGGDEFVLLIQDLKGDDTQVKNQVVGIARKLLDVIREPIYVYGHRFDISCSIGIKLLDQSRLSSTLVLREADMAMYQAKHQHYTNMVFAEDISFDNYGLITTHVPEIDREHNEIDAIIEEGLKGDVDSYAILRNLVKVIKRHFKREEAICSTKSLNMHQDHIDEHKRLSVLLDSLLQKHPNEALNSIKAIKQVVKEHVTDFDSTICPDCFNVNESIELNS